MKLKLEHSNPLGYQSLSRLTPLYIQPQIYNQMDNMELMRNQDNMEQPQQDQQQPRVKPPEPPAQNCPRCHSANIKFCYYNNYSISQPRYFCKACCRYWTEGGTLRNIPIGGKRSRTSLASSSSGDELARTIRSFSTTLTSPQNHRGIFPSQFSRAFPSPLVMSPMPNSFQDGGVTFSSSTMQTFPAAINQGAVVGPIGGGAYFGANLAVLQGFALAHLKPQVPQQCQLQNHQFSTQESMILPRPTISWNQSFINSIAGNSLGGSPSFWSGNQASSSFNPNQ